MKTRIISGLIMAPLLIVLYFRGAPLVVAAFLIGALGTWELFQGFQKINIKPSILVAGVSLISLYVLHFLLPEDNSFLSLWLVISIMASCLVLFDVERRRAEDVLATIFGIVYVIFFSFHIVMVDKSNQGILVWMIVITSFCTDIFAYFTGYFLGKRKLCPKLSPKKTVEGALGGVAGSLVFSIVFGLIAQIKIFPHMIVLGIMCSVVAQLGDLTASAFKRKMEIKDYGTIIPGHGGILDRFDSIIFVAPVIYYYILFLMK